MAEVSNNIGEDQNQQLSDPSSNVTMSTEQHQQQHPTSSDDSEVETEVDDDDDDENDETDNDIEESEYDCIVVDNDDIDQVYQENNDLDIDNDDDDDDDDEDEEDDDDDDDGIDNDNNMHPTTATSYPIPVGITVAYQRKFSGGLTPSKEKLGSTKKSTSTSTIRTSNKTHQRQISGGSRSGGGLFTIGSSSSTTKRHRRIHSTSSNTNERLRGGYRKPVASLTVFLEGTTLYTICLVLPTLLGLLLNFYNDVNFVEWKRSSATIVQNRIIIIKDNLHHSIDNICSYYDIDTGEYYFDDSATTSTTKSTIATQSNMDTNLDNDYTSVYNPTTIGYDGRIVFTNTASSPVTVDNPSTVATSRNVTTLTMKTKTIMYKGVQYVYAPIFRQYIRTTSYWLHRSGVCDKVAELLLQQEEEQRTLLLNQYVVSKDTAYWVQDVWIIVICSTILALVRIYIVQSTVPLEDSTTVEALVRCKSVHLLSSDYARTMTPTSTPMSIRKVKRITTGSMPSDNDDEVRLYMTPFLVTPDLNNDRNYIQQQEQQQQQKPYDLTIDQSESNNVGLQWDETERDDDNEHADDNDAYRLVTNFSTPFSTLRTGTTTTTIPTSNLALDDAETDDEEILHISQQQKEQILTNISSSLRVNTTHQQQQQQYGSQQTGTTVTRSPITTPLPILYHRNVNTDHYDSDKMSTTAPTTPRTRLNAAPRYATALFRLMWSTVSSVLALYYFRNSNFWPWYVGGTGATANCWDLSGGLSVGGMDSDFDHSNAVLKRYFLGQGSYHWHSGAFHIISMLILLLHPSSRKIMHSTLDLVVDDDDDNVVNNLDPDRPTASQLLSPKTTAAAAATKQQQQQQHNPTPMKLLFSNSSTAYVRSMAQHILALALISSAYVFSSLRRLGVIGMFAFDISNWFLHLLQVCMNAPIDSKLNQTYVISIVYWVGVLPTFITARFIIWPLLWYSATFESQRWLVQLEKTLWIGSALTLRYIFHVWMILIQILNMVYLYRLLYHPHFIKLSSQKPIPVKEVRNESIY